MTEVSIRAPRVRGDMRYFSSRSMILCFNPRPSCEGRSGAMLATTALDGFQSAPLV